MNGLKIFYMKGHNNRENIIGVNLRGQSDIEDLRKVVLAIKEPLEKNFPNTEVKLTPGAQQLFNPDC